MQPAFRPSVPYCPSKSSSLRDPEAHAAYSNFENYASDTHAAYVRRLIDVVHICLQRGHVDRAQRAFALLVRCQRVPLAMKGWHALSLSFLPHTASGSAPNEFARGKKPATLLESVLRLVSLHRSRQALDELELYITSYPYSEDATLHVYAGMLCLFLAQESPFRRSRSPSVSSNASATPRQRKGPAIKLPPLDPKQLNTAQSYFKTAVNLYKTQGESDGPGIAFVKRLTMLLPGHEDESDDDSEPIDEGPEVARPYSPVVQQGSDSEHEQLKHLHLR